jgi:hypothetical protein
MGDIPEFGRQKTPGGVGVGGEIPAPLILDLTSLSRVLFW